MSQGLSVLGSYMFSKAIRDGREESGAGGTSNSLPQYPLNISAERSFNATNTPAFGAPNAQVGAPAFGRINSANTRRNLQAGLKAIF